MKWAGGGLESKVEGTYPFREDSMGEVKRTDAGEPRCRAAKGGAGRGSCSTMGEHGPWSLGTGVRISALSFFHDVNLHSSSVT